MPCAQQLIPHIANCLLQTYFILHTPYCTLHATHSTPFTTHCTLCNEYIILHTPHFELHTTLCYKYIILHTTHRTLHSPHWYATGEFLAEGQEYPAHPSSSPYTQLHISQQYISHNTANYTTLYNTILHKITQDYPAHH